MRLILYVYLARNLLLSPAHLLLCPALFTTMNVVTWNILVIRWFSFLLHIVNHVVLLFRGLFGKALRYWPMNLLLSMPKFRPSHDNLLEFSVNSSFPRKILAKTVSRCWFKFELTNPSHTFILVKMDLSWHWSSDLQVKFPQCSILRESPGALSQIHHCLGTFGNL